MVEYGAGFLVSVEYVVSLLLEKEEMHLGVDRLSHSWAVGGDSSLAAARPLFGSFLRPSWLMQG